MGMSINPWFIQKLLTNQNSEHISAMEWSQIYFCSYFVRNNVNWAEIKLRVCVSEKTLGSWRCYALDEHGQQVYLMTTQHSQNKHTRVILRVASMKSFPSFFFISNLIIQSVFLVLRVIEGEWTNPLHRLCDSEAASFSIVWHMAGQVNFMRLKKKEKKKRKKGRGEGRGEGQHS